MEDFDWQGKRKVSSRFGDWGFVASLLEFFFSLLFFLFAFSPLSLPPFFPFSLFLQPGNLEVRLGHVENREGLGHILVTRTRRVGPK